LIINWLLDVFASLATHDNRDDHYGFKYSVLAAIGGKVLQEAQQRIETNAERIAALEAQIDTIQRSSHG
jgi:hypothetical protein